MSGLSDYLDFAESLIESLKEDKRELVEALEYAKGIIHSQKFIIPDHIDMDYIDSTLAKHKEGV